MKPTDAERIEELTKHLKLTNESWRRMHRANGVLRESLKYIAKHDFIGEGSEDADLFANDFISTARTALDSPT